MIPRSLPDYVERGGRQVWRPPYTAREADVVGFVLDCDRAALDVLLRRDLVEPAGGAVDYRSAHSGVVVLFASISRLASREDPDRLRGYMPQREVSVWCLAADMTAPGRLVWYLPYVFSDSGQTVASGREVYGYPKQIGFFDNGYPAALAGGGVTTVEALAVHPFDADTAAVRRPMITATRAPSAPSGREGVVASGAAAFGDLTTLLAAGLGVDKRLPFGRQVRPSMAITSVTGAPPPPPPPAFPWIRRVLDSLQGRDLTGEPHELVLRMINHPTLVFLKQFRDAACPTKACYQAVVEAPLAVNPIGARYETLDAGLFEVAIEDWDSHPIATELGIVAGAPLAPEMAFRAKFSFDVQLGLEVWRAAT